MERDSEKKILALRKAALRIDITEEGAVDRETAEIELAKITAREKFNPEEKNLISTFNKLRRSWFNLNPNPNDIFIVKAGEDSSLASSHTRQKLIADGAMMVNRINGLEKAFFETTIDGTNFAQLGFLTEEQLSLVRYKSQENLSVSPEDLAEDMWFLLVGNHNPLINADSRPVPEQLYARLKRMLEEASIPSKIMEEYFGKRTQAQITDAIYQKIKSKIYFPVPTGKEGWLTDELKGHRPIYQRRTSHKISLSPILSENFSPPSIFDMKLGHRRINAVVAYLAEKGLSELHDQVFNSDQDYMSLADYEKFYEKDDQKRNELHKQEAKSALQVLEFFQLGRNEFLNNLLSDLFQDIQSVWRNTHLSKKLIMRLQAALT